MTIWICYNTSGTIIGVRASLVSAQNVTGCLTIEEWTPVATEPVVYKREWVKK